AQSRAIAGSAVPDKVGSPRGGGAVPGRLRRAFAVGVDPGYAAPTRRRTGMRRVWIVSAMMAAGGGGFGGWGAKGAGSGPTPPAGVASGTATSPGQVTQIDTVQATATVVDVDSRRRRVSLRGPDGVVETFRVGQDVRNLAQMRRGDQVV